MIRRRDRLQGRGGLEIALFFQRGDDALHARCGHDAMTPRHLDHARDFGLPIIIMGRRHDASADGIDFGDKYVKMLSATAAFDRAIFGMFEYDDALRIELEFRCQTINRLLPLRRGDCLIRRQNPMPNAIFLTEAQSITASVLKIREIATDQ